MSEFQEGQRVHVEFDGTIVNGPDFDREFHILADGATTDGYVLASHLTPIAQPVKVGDVLTPDSPTPTVGLSIIAEGFGTVARSKSYSPGVFDIASGEQACPWGSLIRAWREARVLHVDIADTD